MLHKNLHLLEMHGYRQVDFGTMCRTILHDLSMVLRNNKAQNVFFFTKQIKKLQIIKK